MTDPIPPLRAHDWFETRDSGYRVKFDSGMVRDTEAGKARFDLLVPLGVPYEAQMLTRFARLMARGAEKYEARNWELARGEAELLRYRSSAFRHLIQWMTGGQSDNDPEDHAAAVMFNILAGETVRWKMQEDEETNGPDAYDGTYLATEGENAGHFVEGPPEMDSVSITDEGGWITGSASLDPTAVNQPNVDEMNAALAAITCYNRDTFGNCQGHSHSSSPTGVIYHDWQP